MRWYIKTMSYPIPKLRPHRLLERVSAVVVGIYGVCFSRQLIWRKTRNIPPPNVVYFNIIPNKCHKYNVRIKERKNTRISLNRKARLRRHTHTYAHAHINSSRRIHEDFFGENNKGNKNAVCHGGLICPPLPLSSVLQLTWLI